jgi:2-polyprenyl-3-methyl-5-hydroxy-6-metoxy-1,4-benzoquinol methylase
MIQANIDDVRDYWDRQPCNVLHSDHPRGSREYFDQVEYRKLHAEPHILNFTEFANWRDKDVLEIGCGLGTQAVNFARCGARYTGIELSAVSLDLSRQRFDVYGLQGDFYQGNAEELDTFLPSQKYDLIYSWGVIHHSLNPARILSQAQKYLKSSGTLKIMVYAQHSWKNYMIEAGLDQPEAQWGCPIVHTYTRSGLEQMLNGAGFRVTDMCQDHIFPYEIEAYRRREYQLQPWFQVMPKKMFTTLEQHLGWHLMATAVLASGDQSCV